MVKRCQAAPLLAADTETSGLRWDLHARIVGYGFACAHEAGGTQAYYLPFRHKTGEHQVPEEAACRAVEDILARSRKDQLRLWWNRKFDDHMRRREAGTQLDDEHDLDVMIDARLYDENTSAKLKQRALIDLGVLEAHVYEEILDRETVRLAKMHGLGKKEYTHHFGFSQIPVHMAGIYGCCDVEWTLGLYNKYCELGVRSYYSNSPRGPEYPGIWQTEQRLARVLCDVEEWGLPVNRAYFDWLRVQTLSAVERLDQQVWATLGQHRRINLDSDDELREFLVKGLGLPLYQRTQSGLLSVDREVLEDFTPECPILSVIRDRREAVKIASTYTDSLMRWADADDVIHGDYQQMGTDTGRASCKEPSLQNQAADSDARALAATGKKLEDGGRDPWSVRRGFPVRSGFVRAFLDWSQIELRELADFSQDPQLLDVYRTGGDIHDRTCQLIFGRVEKAKRKTCKMANFGTAFGLTPVGLSRRARIPIHEAEAFMRDFYAAYAGVDAARQRLWAQARANGGWITNKFGRTRRIPQILMQDDRDRSRAERQMTASRIQGGAAELAKYAVVAVDAFLKRERLETRMCGWIHDENQFDIPPREFGYVVPRIKAIMENFRDYSVPIVADAEYSVTDWSEKQDVPGLS